jgi:ankyrin repeat protein
MMVWEDCFELEPYQEQMSTLLIRRGADPNEKDRDGNTLLHKLVQTSYDKKIFRYLINNMKVDPYIADGENKTPLYKAALIPNKIAVTELLK